MTITDYREKYGADFYAQMQQPWFVALMALLDTNHPLRTLRNKGDGDKLAGAALYLSQIDGFEKAMEVFRALGEVQKPEPPPIPDTFAEPEILPDLNLS